MSEVKKFFQERNDDIEHMGNDEVLKQKSLEWMLHADQYKYTYNFTWMGRPIIKFPQDILALQEIIWETKPDIIIETGIAHGGSIIFSASMLKLVNNNGKVLAVDIDIRQHNRIEIENHPMYKSIKMFEGSSTDLEIVEKLKNEIPKNAKVMVILDSLHTHEHVLEELEIYSKLVTEGMYLILPDTFIEFFPKGYYDNRPWDVGNNPYTALMEFLSKNNDFIIDKKIVNKMMITEGIDGFLKKVGK
ncbi:cephalosporin hydroxylase family protein [Lysinibacillus pakistanensis]|uniref:cephalosporin hydroxylase family protein n=1 Tax=Lysinibacillus pakistanensis TaxID=759811 RepID=UPI003D279558